MVFNSNNQQDSPLLQRSAALILKYVKKELSAQEAVELEEWLKEEPHRAFFEQMINEEKIKGKYLQFISFNVEDGWRKFADVNRLNKPAQHVTHITKWLKYVSAAVLILGIGSGIYYFNTQSYKSPKITVQTKDIAPGSNKAIWTLGDGKQVELDSTVLDMTAKGKLSYNIGYNELRTPRGGQYQLILPDGSKVWLNAASSIKYPVVFGEERRVDITGEAYFEIEKDARKPFKVYNDEQQIEVLGTSFNVNTYDDEPVKKTTLISGSIKITSNNQTAILKPGQQSSIPITSITKIKQITVQTINADHEIAWIHGKLALDNITVSSLLRQISRWYDVDIVYEGEIPVTHFGGIINRNTPLNDLLDVLKEGGVRTTVAGKKIIVHAGNQ